MWGKQEDSEHVRRGHNQGGLEWRSGRRRRRWWWWRGRIAKFKDKEILIPPALWRCCHVCKPPDSEAHFGSEHDSSLTATLVINIGSTDYAWWGYNKREWAADRSGHRYSKGLFRFASRGNPLSQAKLVDDIATVFALGTDLRLNIDSGYDHLDSSANKSFLLQLSHRIVSCEKWP